MINFEIEKTHFNDKVYNIKDFNAVEGGIVNNKEAIQKCINYAYENGGGKVVIPKGYYLSGPIELLSNVNLHLERQAFLVFTKNKEDYPLIITEYEGEKRIRAISPISSKNQTNIAITGEGIIDGCGDLWRPIKEFKLTKKAFDAKLKINDSVIETPEGRIWFPTKTAYEGCVRGEVDPNSDNALEEASKYYDFYRPVLVSLINCNKILIDGVTLQNSPAWNVHPLLCRNVTISNVTIKNSYSAQNGDGLDLESCENCEVYNSVFDVGDDGICLKSGKGRIARELKKPTKNIYIHDCTVYNAHGGFVVGSETSRGLNNIYVTDCTFIGTDIGIRFKSALGRGGVIENIHIKNIRMKDIIEEAIIFTMGYQLFTLDHEKADISTSTLIDDVPIMQDIFIDNVYSHNSKTALKINGLDNYPIKNITISNSYISALNSFDLKNYKNIKLINTKIEDIKEKRISYFENEILK